MTRAGGDFVLILSRWEKIDSHWRINIREIRQR
jgi:hypothetical protein